MNGLRLRVRFDYIGQGKAGKKLFGNKGTEQLAEEIRQHKVSQIRNVPVQGIHIEDIDMSQEIYSVIDEITGRRICYAPVSIMFAADTLEDVLRFIMKEEFRTIEVLEPEQIELSRIEMERLLLRINDELANYRDYLERKIDNWK
ncbi:MAG: hypothetical protein WC109_06390 [Syntrophomonadaceae bacterium]|nr:hypothetical protein [Syntrophomonadaceae bacterium]MDD3898318.1 hypothetical protein [Syntrophomonadaceae bacterium]